MRVRAVLGFRPRILVFLAGAALHQGPVLADVDYNRDVLPIFSSRCFSCHGVDGKKRKAKLRLDVKEAAFAEREGVRAIVPGRPAESALVRRIFSAEKDEVMPPPGKGPALTEAEKTVLRDWIAQGAPYREHWAFERPRKGAVPLAGNWGVNEVDRFIRARLKKTGLEPQAAASKGELLRRVTFDITGLPPTAGELDAFLGDDSPRAYEKVVDGLLASPRFGERLAMWWLDGARYGDSHGYDNDLENSQWPWRDWVIRSFNANKPFDEFTVEQLAGDLLEKPTNDQVIATGFNRNHRINTEGGAIDEEWRTEYVIDRVETMGMVWMGLSLGCARCHEHKYDPLSQKEFYQLFAFFNNLDEKGFINNLRGSAEPRVPYKENPKVQVMIMREQDKLRVSRVLKGGQYDAPGEEVKAGLPAFLPPLPEGEKMSRLGLARWLVNGNHPLTARVVVNRLWEQLFGTGIVKSVENLGVQADWPSHPALLDWLAVDFTESGWNLKAFIRKLLLSSTYRQSHVVDAKRLRLDPANRLLSRGPRFRLQAEMVRDQALALSGLLVEKLGGPSVKPYQPAGLWEEVEKRGKFKRGNGQDLYRRSLYTNIRRTVAPPSMLLFDMPSREVCTVQRTRTNTPLQALALMNEVTYVEAAKKFAERMVGQEADAGQRIAWGFRCATQRAPDEEELRILLAGYKRRLGRFKREPESARKLLERGEAKVSDGLDRAELAAMMTVAGVLLNLDEVINK